MKPPDILCGEEVDGMMYQNGTITSPGFPENYPAFLNCRYIIRAMPGIKSFLLIESFFLNLLSITITNSFFCLCHLILFSSSFATYGCYHTFFLVKIGSYLCLYRFML